MTAARWPRLVGVLAFTTALSLHRSEASRPVLGTWSSAYLIVLAGGLGLLLLSVVASARSMRSGRRSPVEAQLLDWAILFAGAAYLTSALERPASAARILEGNLLGSVLPLAAFAEWVAMTLGLTAAALWAADRLGETGRKLLLSAAVFGLIALLGEGALRLRAALAPRTHGFPTHTEMQWKRRFVRENSLGFRDVEHPFSAPRGTRRLLVVGDSVAFGSGLDRVEDSLASSSPLS